MANDKNYRGAANAEPEEVSKGAYYLLDAPIAELAEREGVSVDEAVKMRVAAALKNAPLQFEVTARPIEPKGNLVGFATVKFGGSFVVEDLRVVNGGEKGLFVGMPSKPDGKGGYRDTAKPVTAAFRAALHEAVIEAYHTQAEKLQTRAAAALATPKSSIQKQLADGAEQAAKQPARASHGKGKDKTGAEH